MTMIQNMIETYNQIYNVSKDYPFETIVTDTIYSERLKLCNTEDEKKKIEASKETLENSLELLVLPDDTDPNFYLLLHESLFNETNGYCQSITYGYTQLIDYWAIKEKYNISNLRNHNNPDLNCVLFLSEARANFRSYNLFYNLASLPKKAVLFSYLCEMIPHYEKDLSYDLPLHMDSLAKFYGQCLAVSDYADIDLSLPDYLKSHPIDGLLQEVHDAINNATIFENYESIQKAYDDYIFNKSKLPFDASTFAAHKHTCNHSNDSSHID
jgi:hypothetical protein